MVVDRFSFSKFSAFLYFLISLARTNEFFFLKLQKKIKTDTKNESKIKKHGSKFNIIIFSLKNEFLPHGL